MVLGDPNDKYTPDLRWPVFTRKSMAGFTRKLTPWRSIYNHERPHHALELEVPSSRYTISDRTFLEVTGTFEYSEEFETRRLHQKTGQFRFQGSGYRISEAFLDQSI